MTGFTLPTSRPITQKWGEEFYDFDGDGINEYPNGFYHTYVGWIGHNGIDYGCFTGDPIEAVADGIVEYAGNGDFDPLMTYGGNVVRIRHDAYNVRSGYLHLSEVLVSAGQTVKKGQVIAKSGATGKVTAPHLHLEMYRIGEVNQSDGWRGRIDPTPYLYGELNSDYATKKGLFVYLTEAQEKIVYDRISKYVDAPVSAVPKKSAALTWATTILRGGRKISALQELANANTALGAAATQIKVLQSQLDVANKELAALKAAQEVTK